MAKLTIVDSSGREREVDIGSKPLVFGRAEDCDVILGSRSVSRHHMKMWEEDDRVMVEDLAADGSLALNGEPVEGVFELPPGVELETGVFSFSLPAVESDEDLNAGPEWISPVLKGIKGTVKGIEIELQEGDNDIGRDPDMYVVIDDPSISRQHVRLLVSKDSTTLIDMRSSNGTFVNGKRVDTVDLHSGDLVRIGKLDFKFVRGALTSKGAKALKRKRLLLFGGGGTLGLLFLVAISVKMCHKPPQKVDPKPPELKVEPVQERVDLHMSTAKAHMENKDWTKAQTEVDAALKIHPICVPCRALKEKIELEIMNKHRYEECRVNFELSEWRKALDCFMGISQDSTYYQATKYKIAECKSHLSSHHMAEGKGFYHARHYDKAHAHFVKYMLLNPCDRKVFDKYVVPIQRRLRGSKAIKPIKFNCAEQAAPAVERVDPRKLIAAKYPNGLIKNAMLTYHAGKIQRSLELLRKISLQYANQELGEQADELEAQIKVVRGTNKEALSALMRGDLKNARKAIQTVFRYDAQLMPGGVISHHHSELARQMTEWLYRQGLEAFGRQNFVTAFDLWADCHQNYASDATCQEGLLQLEKVAEKKLEEATKFEQLGDVRAFNVWKEIMSICRPESMPFRKAKQKMVEYEQQ